MRNKEMDDCVYFPAAKTGVSPNRPILLRTAKPVIGDRRPSLLLALCAHRLIRAWT